MDSFYSRSELERIGFASIGKNVLLSRKASIYSPATISFGDNVRVDDFCILSGHISIASQVHISAYVALYGGMGITIGDYSGVSARTTIYSAIDDFGGDYLIGPMCPVEMTHVTGGQVVLQDYVQVGASCVVMPSLTVAEGSVVGAMSFVNQSLDAWGVYAGIPVRRLRDRSRKLLDFTNDLYDGR